MEKIPLEDAWKVLAPRPVAIITTVNERGEINGAPYSLVGSMSFSPPLVWVGFNKDGIRHTFENIKATKEFVLNIVSEDFAKEMIETAKIEEWGNELEKAGLQWGPSKIVRPPRVKKAKAVLECMLRGIYEVGGSHTIVVGEVVNAEATKIDAYGNPKFSEMKTLYHASGPVFYSAGKSVELNWRKKR